MLFKDRRTGAIGELRTAKRDGKKYTVTRDTTGDVQVTGPDGSFEAAPHAKGNLYAGKKYRPGTPNQEVKNTVKAIKKGKIDQIKAQK
jgi:hypothetical protein